MSGQRFGGDFSPGRAKSPRPDPATTAASALPSNRFRGRKAARVDVRARLLYILPTPLLFSAFGSIGGGNPVDTALALAAYASLMAGAWLLGEGQKAEAAYEARAVARRPAIPRKIMAAIGAGLGVALAHLAGTPPDVASAIGFGGLALGTHLLAFGIDPLKNKGIDFSDAESGRVAAALEKAEAMLSDIDGFADRTRDREIAARLHAMAKSVRGMLRQIEGDPRDLVRARRYLSVYLVSAHEATRKYAEAHENIRDPSLRSDYLSLLSELEGSFARGHDKLLAEDRTDLEVEIEVLRERLGQEAGH